MVALMFPDIQLAHVVKICGLKPNYRSRRVINDYADHAKNNLLLYRSTSDIKYRDRIISDNYNAISSIAKRIHEGYKEFDFEDFRQESALGFAKGIEKYDFEKAQTENGIAKVVSFCLNYSRKFILQFIEDNAHAVRVGRNALRLAHKATKIRTEENEDGFTIPFDVQFQHESPAVRIGAIHAKRPMVSPSKETEDNPEGIFTGISYEEAPDKEEWEKREAAHNDKIQEIEIACSKLSQNEKQLLYSSCRLFDLDFGEVCVAQGLCEMDGQKAIRSIIKKIKSPQLGLF